MPKTSPTFHQHFTKTKPNHCSCRTCVLPRWVARLFYVLLRPSVMTELLARRLFKFVTYECTGWLVYWAFVSVLLRTSVMTSFIPWTLFLVFVYECNGWLVCWAFFLPQHLCCGSPFLPPLNVLTMFAGTAFFDPPPPAPGRRLLYLSLLFFWKACVCWNHLVIDSQRLDCAPQSTPRLWGASATSATAELNVNSNVYYIVCTCTIYKYYI